MSLIDSAPPTVPPPFPPASAALPPPPPPLDATSLPLPSLPPAPTRPPLLRANTSGALSTTSSTGGGGPQPSGCRLLWRGRLNTDDGRTLHGIAIIAHLFTLSKTASALPQSPHLAAAPAPSHTLSPFDDPFASASSVASSGADMCLGLEMLRGGDIRIKGEVGVKMRGESPAAVRAGGGRGKKGKGKEEREVIEVETPTDVRVYIDQRCPETVEWFEDMFCREGRERVGIRIDAGGEEVVLFASYPSLSELTEQKNFDPSTSALPPRPPLTLLLGRPSRAAVRKPRPDDPMPRESLFTKKLRKTASLPASAFAPSLSTSSLSGKPLTKLKRQTAKDQAIASLLGAVGGKTERPKPKHASSLPAHSGFPPPPPPLRHARSLSRAPSSTRLFPSAGQGRDSSLPPTANPSASSSRRASLEPSSTRPFQRTQSRSSMLLDSPPSSDNEALPSAGGEGDSNGFLHPLRFKASSATSRRGSRAPSPTPSITSTLAGMDGEELLLKEEDDEMEMEESQDAVAELRSFRAGSVSGGVGGGAAKARRKGGMMARSSSLPVGKFGMGGEKEKEEKERGVKRRKLESEGTTLRPSRAGSVGPLGGAGEAGTVEAKNKITVKKITLNRLVALGVGKDHPEFHDVYSMTTRGVGFAMREAFKTTLFSTADRRRSEDLVEQHLKMYLPAALCRPPPPPPAPAALSLADAGNPSSFLPTPTPGPSHPPPPPAPHLAPVPVVAAAVLPGAVAAPAPVSVPAIAPTPALPSPASSVPPAPRPPALAPALPPPLITNVTTAPTLSTSTTSKPSNPFIKRSPRPSTTASAAVTIAMAVKIEPSDPSLPSYKKTIGTGAGMGSWPSPKSLGEEQEEGKRDGAKEGEDVEMEMDETQRYEDAGVEAGGAV